MNILFYICSGNAAKLLEIEQTDHTVQYKIPEIERSSAQVRDLLRFATIASADQARLVTEILSNAPVQTTAQTRDNTSDQPN